MSAQKPCYLEDHTRTRLSKSFQGYFDGITFEKKATEPKTSLSAPSRHESCLTSSNKPINRLGTTEELPPACNGGGGSNVSGYRIRSLIDGSTHSAGQLQLTMKERDVKNDTIMDKNSVPEYPRTNNHVSFSDDETDKRKAFQSIGSQVEGGETLVASSIQKDSYRSPFPPSFPIFPASDRRTVSECLFQGLDSSVQVRRKNLVASEQGGFETGVTSLQSLPPIDEARFCDLEDTSQYKNKYPSLKLQLLPDGSEGDENSRRNLLACETPKRDITGSMDSTFGRSAASLPEWDAQLIPPYLTIKPKAECDLKIFVPLPPPLPKISTNKGYPALKLKVLSSCIDQDILHQILEVKGKLKRYIPHPPAIPSFVFKARYPVIRLKTIDACEKDHVTFKDKLMAGRRMLQHFIPEAPPLKDKVSNAAHLPITSIGGTNARPRNISLKDQLLIARRNLRSHIPKTSQSPAITTIDTALIQHPSEDPTRIRVTLNETIQHPSGPLVSFNNRAIHNMGSQTEDKVQEAQKLVQDVCYLFGSSSFLSLSVSELREMLSDNYLPVSSELEVARAGIHWIDYIYAARQIWTTSVMSCVRFAYMSHEEIDTLGSLSPNIVDNKDLQSCIKNAHWQVTCMLDGIPECLRKEVKIQPPRIVRSGGTMTIPKHSSVRLLSPGIAELEMPSNISISSSSSTLCEDGDHAKKTVICNAHRSSSEISTDSQWSTVSEASSVRSKSASPNITMDLKLATPAGKSIPHFLNMPITQSEARSGNHSGHKTDQTDAKAVSSSSDMSSISRVYSDSGDSKEASAAWSSCSSISTDSQWSTTSGESSLKSSVILAREAAVLPTRNEDPEQTSQKVTDPQTAASFNMNSDSGSDIEKSPKQQHTVYVIGATDEGESITGSSIVLEYNTRDNTWRTEQIMENAQLNNTAACLGKYIYLSGGSSAQMWHHSKMKASRGVKRYDLVQKKWSYVSPMNKPRSHHGLVVMNGKLIAVGGQDNEENILDSVECYDPRTDCWTYLPSLNLARMGSAVTVFQHHIVVAGGYGGRLNTEQQFDLLDSVECFNPVDNRWTGLNPLRMARCFASLTTCKEKLFLSGGMVFNHFTPSNWCSIGTVEVYDVDSDMWKRECRFAVPRHNFGTFTEDERIYFIGGNIVQFSAVVPTVECYDTENRTWDMDCENMPYALTGPISIVCPKI